jgi:hypothetical protein
VNYLKHRGTTKTTPVIDDDDGRVGGKHVEHWDDHVDALALARRGQLFVPDGGIVLPSLDKRVLRQDSDLGRAAMQRGVRPAIAGGAFGTSGLFVENFIDVLDATQLAIDTSLTSHKIALFLDALTPDYSVNQDFTAAPYTSNQSSGAGYTAGGQVIVSPTTTESPGGTLMYDMADQVWASPTSVTARGAILYADVLATNSLIVGVTFGSDFTSTAGTFTIQWNALGVFTLDLTP